MPLPQLGSDPVLLTKATLAAAGDALFVLLRTDELRQHRVSYQALKRAWLVLTDLYALAISNEDPDYTEAIHASEVGVKT